MLALGTPSGYHHETLKSLSARVRGRGETNVVAGVRAIVNKVGYDPISCPFPN